MTSPEHQRQNGQQRSMSRSEYFVVEMPLNAYGFGPEMDDSKVIETRFQIWDSSSFYCVAEYTSKEEADYECSRLNQFTS